MRTDRRGMTLIEVLVCLAIVGGSVISLLVARDNATLQAAEAIGRRQAQMLATNKIQEIMSGVERGRQGNFKSEGFPEIRWSKKTRKVPLDAYPTTRKGKKVALSASWTQTKTNITKIELLLKNDLGESLFELVAFEYEPKERSDEEGGS
ncbi:MAG: prepilin-type N-terminal cleavage/methylation domain-containing protein [Planctomycetota bacterium]|nr:prepilin-type N-terminal cleavage/methylation domain-containing protein [Planctomycetota bacterium]